jgi:hypothetical protein
MTEATFNCRFKVWTPGLMVMLAGSGCDNSGAEARAAGRRQNEAAAALVSLVDLHLQEPAPLERLQIGGERAVIHREERRHAADARGLRPVERHQERELATGQAERPQRRVEAPRQGARRPLDMETETAIANPQRDRERRFGR